MTPPLFGVAGWKNSGKTTLMVGLVSELTRRGLAVSVIKHAHAKFDIDHPGRDSFRMREAGACQVALVVASAFCLDARAWRRARNVVRRDSRLCGSVRSRSGRGLQARDFSEDRDSQRWRGVARAAARHLPGIVAIASDRPDAERWLTPCFHLDDIKGIADFIVATLGLKQP